MFHKIGPAHFQRILVQPDHHGAKSSRYSRAILGRYQHVSAAEVDLIFETQGHRHRSKRLGQVAVVAYDRAHSRSLSGRQGQHVVTGANQSTGDTAGKPPEVGMRANHYLHRESQTFEGIAGAERNRLQVFEQRRSLIPKHALASLYNVISLQRADWHAPDMGDAKLLCQLQKIPLDIQKHIFSVIHEVHFVHCRKNTAYPEKRSDERMAPSL